ncbi:hypothetical protein ACFWY6_05430 [Streptomyces sp. NPDC059037]|uniref:hypothetical protein n=1 Tax=Streptomyces sp. NPDC059037 TaxID=3346710 RepID=UPI0036AC86EE
MSTAAVGALLTLTTPADAIPDAPRSAPCTPFGNTTADRTDERSSCLDVALRLSKAPAVGARARLDIEVRTTAQRSDVRLDVELPAGLVWVDAPKGLVSRTTDSAVPVHRGRLHHAEGRGHTGSRQPWRLSGTVKAVSPGSAEIRAAATTTSGDGGDTGSVFLTVGDRHSSPGIAVKDDNPTATETRSRTRAHSHLTHKPAGQTPTASTASVTAGTACVTGGWGYTDHTGAARVAPNSQVKVYDKDTDSEHDLLGSVLTGSDGRYRFCFDNADGEGGGQDVYVQLATENSRWIVRNGETGNSYRFTTSVRSEVGSGTTADFGALRPADEALMRGIEAFDTVNAAWNWRPGTCWDARDTNCRRAQVNWAPDSTEGAYYSRQDNAVSLTAADPDAPMIVLHELGHALMDDVYEDDYPPTSNCSPHYVRRASSKGCAWSEGFATWFGATVLKDPTMRWADGSTLDLEGPTWGTTGWDNGDTVEGRVTGAMIDLADGANESGDSCSENPAGPLWNTFLDHVSDTFGQYWAQRAADGYDVGATQLGCLYHNTIDYRS